MRTGTRTSLWMVCVEQPPCCVVVGTFFFLSSFFLPDPDSWRDSGIFSFVCKRVSARIRSLLRVGRIVFSFRW